MAATHGPSRPYYLQTDPEWKDEAVGGSREPLANVGCTVCCVSMAFSQLGTPVDPKMLNAELKGRNGYTKSGLLKWDVAAAASGNAIAFDLPGKPSHAAIDAAVQSGNPVIAKILLWESVPHWVLIVGKEGDDYLVKNPLCQERTFQKLSAVSATIQAIRIARRK